jgi:hypothetical protein
MQTFYVLWHPANQNYFVKPINEVGAYEYTNDVWKAERFYNLIDVEKIHGWEYFEVRCVQESVARQAQPPKPPQPKKYVGRVGHLYVKSKGFLNTDGINCGELTLTQDKSTAYRFDKSWVNSISTAVVWEEVED